MYSDSKQVSDYGILLKYFSELTTDQQKKFSKLYDYYRDWNSKINVISRKDIDFLYERHVLHSLAIAKFVRFKSGTKVLDVGTGGGFPGVPLAILLPEVEFHLVDSIGKKIKVVNEITSSLQLKNVLSEQARVEDLRGSYDFVVSRAVADVSIINSWVKGKISKKSSNNIPNGTILLKGGDLTEELSIFIEHVRQVELSRYFDEPFFETKKIVFLPLVA